LWLGPEGVENIRPPEDGIPPGLLKARGATEPEAPGRETLPPECIPPELIGGPPP